MWDFTLINQLLPAWLPCVLSSLNNMSIGSVRACAQLWQPQLQWLNAFCETFPTCITRLKFPRDTQMHVFCTCFIVAPPSISILLRPNSSFCSKKQNVPLEVLTLWMEPPSHLGSYDCPSAIAPCSITSPAQQIRSLRLSHHSSSFHYHGYYPS